jgi:hypothetical protein
MVRSSLLCRVRFLRKAVLGIGQVQLAERLRITRPTVARWESAQSLSPEHDFELRSLVLGDMLAKARAGGRRWKKAELFEATQIWSRRARMAG